MPVMNPLILKELIQAAHRRRTYVLRAGLPLVAGVIIGIQIFAFLSVMERVGYDWRRMADIARPVFDVIIWMQLFVLGFMALVYGGETLRLEWTRRTIEALCATPISKRAIVFGKFVSVLCRILLVAMALLPILVMTFSLGHIPAGLAVGSLAVIAASTTMCGAVALLFSSLHRPGSWGWDLQILYVMLPLIAFVAAVIHWQDNPFIVAAMPPWALYFVMNDSAPRGVMNAAWFKVLAAAEPLAIAGLALWLAPVTFGYSFNRYEGGGPVSGRRKRASRWLRWVLGHRPTLRDGQNPFAWQEKGIGTVALRWSVWPVYLVVLAVALAVQRRMYHENPFAEPALYIGVGFAAAAVMILAAGAYGVDVFVREKERRTVEALLLTGNKPSKFYSGKLTAAYRALRWPLVSVAGLLVVALCVGSQAEWTPQQVTVIAVCCLLGPAVAAGIGMAFGAAARTRGEAISAVICSPVLAWLLVIPIRVAELLSPYDARRTSSDLPLAIGAIAMILAVRCFTRNWTVWRLSLILAAMELLTFVTFDALGRAGVLLDNSVDLFFIVAVVAVAAGLFWYRLGVSLFDRCMLNLADRPGKK